MKPRVRPKGVRCDAPNGFAKDGKPWACKRSRTRERSKANASPPLETPSLKEPAPRTRGINLTTRTRRLFFALWPDAATRERLTEALRGIKPAPARATHSDDLHITLVFLGSLDTSTQHCAEQAAALVRAEPFTLTLDKLGHWQRPRILWLGAAHCPDALLDLVSRLGRALQPCKIKPDERPYQPHLTFARKVQTAAALPALSEPIEWPVSSFALVESQPINDGARYRVLTTWPLAAAG